MIPTSILLPALSQKDRAEFTALCSAHSAGKALISTYNNDARVARKKELRTKLKTAPHDQLLSIGAELETLDASFLQAKRGAKDQLRALTPRYLALFPNLLGRCEAHADGLIGEVKNEWAKHFKAFGAVPTGESPLVPFLVQWKRSLASIRQQLELAAATGLLPSAPTDLLPYSSNGGQS